MNPGKRVIPGAGGPQNIDLGFEAPNFIRAVRYDELDSCLGDAAERTTVHVRAGSFNALDDGRGEINAWLPERCSTDDDEPPVLASIEVHHLRLIFANHGVFRFTGILAAANLYSDDVYQRILAGELPEVIPELATDGHFKYLPPASTQLVPFIGKPVDFHVLSAKR